MEFNPTAPVNTSGQGATALVPDEIKHWSWAGFLMNWIWAIGMNTWIGLLALVPYVGLIMAIILGVKGNEWAWQNRKWESVDHFNKVQSIWVKWGIAILIISAVIGMIVCILVPFLVLSSHSANPMSAPVLPRP
jgi:hypothetical protein